MLNINVMHHVLLKGPFLCLIGLNSLFHALCNFLFCILLIWWLMRCTNARACTLMPAFAAAWIGAQGCTSPPHWRVGCTPGLLSRAIPRWCTCSDAGCDCGKHTYELATWHPLSRVSFFWCTLFECALLCLHPQSATLCDDRHSCVWDDHKLKTLSDLKLKDNGYLCHHLVEGEQAHLW